MTMTMTRPAPIYRQGSTIVQIRCNAPGDGNLSFTAVNVLTGAADPQPPTFDEARAACPYGWVLYEDGPLWRAKPAA